MISVTSKKRFFCLNKMRVILGTKNVKVYQMKMIFSHQFDGTGNFLRNSVFQGVFSVYQRGLSYV